MTAEDPGLKPGYPAITPYLKKPLRASTASKEKDPQSSGLDSPAMRAKD